MGIWERLKNWRNSAGPKAPPIREELWTWAIEEHQIFRGLGEPDSLRLRDLAAAFLAAKRFIPVGGAAAEEETKVSVAAQACLPLLGLDLGWYRDFSTIYLTPKAYPVTQKIELEGGVVQEYEDEFAGEAFSLGPVALSIPDIEASGWGEGYNVVIHEMAHKLDGLDGSCDGCPPLHRGMDQAAWTRDFSQAFQDLKGKSARGKKKRSPIDAYGAESPDEFFAVACEYFWETPRVLAEEYPQVYVHLSLFFRRDPRTFRT